MGFPKLIAPFAGATLLDRALDAAIGSTADVVCVVTGAYQDRMAPLLSRRGALGRESVNLRAHELPPSQTKHVLTSVHNCSWETGQASSVKAAVQFARDCGCSAVLMFVADQPFVQARHLNALINEYRKNKIPLCITSTTCACGNPCLFDESFFDALLMLKGDEGARVLVRTFPNSAVCRMFFDEPHLLDDADTPEDFIRLEKAVLNG
jgi:molybdenum cofactor cytidylyltransferase